MLVLRNCAKQTELNRRFLVMLQAIAMDEDAELAGLSEQVGPKAGVIPAGAMLATPGNQTNRKVPLETVPSDSKSMLGRTSQEPTALLPARSGGLVCSVLKYDAIRSVAWAM